MLVNEFIKRLKTYDPNMELTDEIKNDMKNIFDEFYKEYK